MTEKDIKMRKTLIKAGLHFLRSMVTGLCVWMCYSLFVNMSFIRMSPEIFDKTWMPVTFIVSIIILILLERKYPIDKGDS